jgi:hypothetical protein
MAASTALGERVDAESVREMTLRYFDEMRGADRQPLPPEWPMMGVVRGRRPTSQS